MAGKQRETQLQGAWDQAMKWGERMRSAARQQEALVMTVLMEGRAVALAPVPAGKDLAQQVLEVPSVVRAATVWVVSPPVVEPT